MKSYLENVLHQKLEIEKWDGIYDKLPLGYRGRNDLFY